MIDEHSNCKESEDKEFKKKKAQSGALLKHHWKDKSINTHQVPPPKIEIGLLNLGLLMLVYGEQVT